MWGGDGWWAILLFAMIFGWGGNGFGGFGGGGRGNCATTADVAGAFNFSQLDNGIRGLERGICDSTYAVTGAVNTGFSQAALARCQDQAALMQQLNNMSFQAQDCCCQTQGAIKDLANQLERAKCDVIQSNHNNTDRIIGWLSNQELQKLRDELQTYKFAASQSNQNAVIGAQIDAMGAEVIRRINPAPVPAYTVPAPYPFGYGYGNSYSCGNGCGNGCGCDRGCDRLNGWTC